MVTGDPTRAGVGILGSLNGHRKITNNTMPEHTHEINTAYNPGEYSPVVYNGPEGAHTHQVNLPTTNGMNLYLEDDPDQSVIITAIDPNGFDPPDDVPRTGPTTTPPAEFTSGHLVPGSWEDGEKSATPTGGGEDYLPPALVMNFYIRCK